MTTLAPAAKKDKSRPDCVKTQRFTLTLCDSTEESFPEFNFAELLTSVTSVSLSNQLRIKYSGLFLS